MQHELHFIVPLISLFLQFHSFYCEFYLEKKITVLHFVLSLDKLTFPNTYTKPVMQILC